MRYPRRTFLRSATLTLAGAGAARGALGDLLAPTARSGMPAVGYDSKSLIINGRRELLMSGEMHYARSTREMWPELLDRSKRLGLNCVATYVFWGIHEPKRGVFDFSGGADLAHFLRLCSERGLSVFLRTGPYCCAEWNFGGFPSWLRDEPGITLRTMNEPYLRRVEIYFKRLAEEVRPLLASNGGPVILVQVENEYANVAKRYGEAGQEYLRWMVDLSQRVGLSSVPTTTCVGGAPGAIETANGNVITAKAVEQMLAKHSDTPVLWSELYPAWYQVWGGTRPKPREPQEMASAILEFVGAGGSGWNYYMWHGGTNFGRNSMYLQTTSYNFDAPLDEFGRESRLGLYLGRLHKALRAQQEVILEGRRERTVSATGVVSVVWTSGEKSVRLLANPTAQTATSEEQTLAPRSARVVAGKEVLFDTEADLASVMGQEPQWERVAGDLTWSVFEEPLPQHREDPGSDSAEPVEQLSLTKDESDYCWYSAMIQADGRLESKIEIPYGGDFFYVFVDGRPIAKSEGPFYENRGPIVASSTRYPRIEANRHDEEHVDGYRHRFNLGRLAAGEHRLDLLCTALGMIKGDWQIGYPMNMERKGIWSGVLLDGASLRGWRMRPRLAGEIAGLPNTSKVRWGAKRGEAPPLTWYRSEFVLDHAMLASDADYRIDASGMGKGSVFVNGKAVGRYWLIEAAGSEAPSQRWYHIPRSWLRARNEIVLLEEQDRSPVQLALERRIATPSAG